MKKITNLFLIVGLLLIANIVSAQTSTSTLSQTDLIKQLQEQIKTLQLQVTRLTTELSATKKEVVTIKEELRITKTLKLGTTDEEVKKLQEYLSTMPDIYPEKLVTGYFGPLTEKAVRKLQEKNGLESIGIVGPKTRAKINQSSGESISTNSSTNSVSNTPQSISTNTVKIISATSTIVSTSTIQTQTNNSNGGNGGNSSTQTTPLFMCTNPGQMVTICHNSQTLTVSCQATGPEGHSNHSSDTLGACSTSTSTDITAPIISNIQATTTETTVTITWATNELADSKVIISTSTPLITASSSMTTSHSLSLSSLVSGTTYHYVVVSKDVNGNISTSSEQLFSTRSIIISETKGLELGISTYGGNAPYIKSRGSTYQIQIRFENMSDTCTGCDVTPPTSVRAYYVSTLGGVHYEEETFPISQLNRQGVIWLTWNHPLNAPAGEYNFVVVIDPDNTVTEKNENNNTWPFTFTIMDTTGCDGVTSITDNRDTNNPIYQINKIGNQCWLKRNLNIGTRVDGNANQTNNEVIEKYCYSNNGETNCNDKGGLYQWDEMMNYSEIEGAQGICMTGWHIPTDAEWKTLEISQGMTQEQADGAAWRGLNTGDELKNEGLCSSRTPCGTSGYSAILGGIRYSDGHWDNLGRMESIWTSSIGSLPFFRYLQGDSGMVYRGEMGKMYGFSVRCIRD